MPKIKSQAHHPHKNSRWGNSRKIRKAQYEKPRLDPSLKKIFSKIGIPDSAHFRPDPFQLEALDKLKEYDVLVTAATGSGKTWIASQSIREYLSMNLRVWYASPLKALSNSLYQEFSNEFGYNSVGILTGERKENTDAPIIVGTTEIFRNQLYDAMHHGTSIRTDLVILDEAHYLSDPDRGVVWEEVLIYLPSRVKLLLLSATISNAEEVCSWLEENRGTECQVVRSLERPVPMEMLFLFPDGLISPLSGRKGLTSGVRKFIAAQMVNGRIRGSRKVRYGDILRILRKFDLLPAIFFLKSRLDCDLAILTCHASERTHEEKIRMRKEVEEFLRDYPHLKEHRQMNILMDSLVASHHAGQLPYWKLLVERMMNKGYLDAIFSTSTVAAGVNFPARSVILIQSDRFNGHEFTDLTATDLHQMIGRAGRRGKDKIGFAMVIPGMHQDPQLISRLSKSPPEPLCSQIRINFSMTLNLLLSHTPLEVKKLLESSFANYQLGTKGSYLQGQWKELADALKWMLPKGKCDTSDPYEVIENIRKRSELRREARRAITVGFNEGMVPFLRPGRVFHHRNKGIFVLLYTYSTHDRPMCRAHNISKQVRYKNGRIRLRKIPFEKIKFLYDHIVDISENYSAEELQAIIDGIDIRELKVLDRGAGEKERIDIQGKSVMERLKDLPCHTCDHVKSCHNRKNKDLGKILRDFDSLARGMEGSGQGLWSSFKKHVRFLKETGFVDDMDRLTPDGEWASNLRLDQPLLIAEAIRKGAFSNLGPESVSGCIAPFVWDREIDVDVKMGKRDDINETEDVLLGLIDSIKGIRDLKAARGFDNPPILIWPAMALYLWAKGMSWEELLFHIPVSEGDMASMIVRTADHLRQVSNLKETHKELASVARTAIDLILREPVFLE